MTQLSLIDRDWCGTYAGMVLATFRGREFTADDVRRIVPEPMSQNSWGALFVALRPRLRKIGYRPSARPAANSRVVAVWEVKS